MKTNGIAILTLGISIILSGCMLLPKSQRATYYYNKGRKVADKQGSYRELTPNQSRKAIRYYKKALEANPRHSAALNNLGIAYKNLGMYKEAIDALTTSIKLLPIDGAPYLNRGNVYSLLNRFADAKNDYLMARKLSKRPHIALNNLGNLYGQFGNTEMSKLYYDSAIMYHPEDTFAYVSLGYAYIRLKKYEQSIINSSVAIDKDPTLKEAWNNRGLAKFYIRDYKGAIRDFHAAMNCPDYASQETVNTYLFNNLANCYFAVNETDSACIFWNKAIEMGYQYNPKWEEEYGILDPHELVKEHCQE